MNKTFIISMTLSLLFSFFIISSMMIVNAAKNTLSIEPYTLFSIQKLDDKINILLFDKQYLLKFVTFNEINTRILQIGNKMW